MLYMKNQNMELVGVRLTKGLIGEIDALVEDGGYPNRSELLRDAARMLIRSQKGIFTGMTQPFDKDKLLKEYAKEHGFKL